MSWEPILMLHTLLGEHRANWVVFMCLNWLGSQLELEIRGSFHTLERLQRTPASPSKYGRRWMSR